MEKKTLVLGASLKLSRYSNLAILKLIEKGIEVVAIGATHGHVSHVEIDKELQHYPNVHTVTLYLNPKNQKAYYDYIVSLHPKRVIFNPGAENPELYRILDAHQIHYENACTLALLSTDQY